MHRGPISLAQLEESCPGHEGKARSAACRSGKLCRPRSRSRSGVGNSRLPCAGDGRKKLSPEEIERKRKEAEELGPSEIP